MCRNGHTTCGWQLAQPSLVLFSFFSLFFPKAPELWIAPSLRNWSEPIPFFFSSSSIVLSTRWKKEPPDSLVVALPAGRHRFLGPLHHFFSFSLFSCWTPSARLGTGQESIYIYIYIYYRVYWTHFVCVISFDSPRCRAIDPLGSPFSHPSPTRLYLKFL